MISRLGFCLNWGQQYVALDLMQDRWACSVVWARQARIIWEAAWPGWRWPGCLLRPTVLPSQRASMVNIFMQSNQRLEVVRSPKCLISGCLVKLHSVVTKRYHMRPHQKLQQCHSNPSIKSASSSQYACILSYTKPSSNYDGCRTTYTRQISQPLWANAQGPYQTGLSSQHWSDYKPGWVHYS